MKRTSLPRLQRRAFITLLGGAATWPITARGQQATLPVVAVVNGGAPDQADISAFQRGLEETGYVDGKNLTVEFHRLAGQYEHAPSLMADLVRRGVTVIATPGSTSRPRLRPERSRLYSALATIRSNSVWSRAFPVPVVTRLESVPCL
jgi:putative tryptophan/tyrosine transport system substrate-binding protein